jgi:hypothetical protein
MRIRNEHGLDFAAVLPLAGLRRRGMRAGDYSLAIERYRECLVRLGDRGALLYAVGVLSGVACSAAALGHTGAAIRSFGAAQALLERVGIAAFDPAWQAIVDRHRAAVQRTLGDEDFASACAEGRHLSRAALMDAVTALSESAPATSPTLPAPARRRGRGSNPRTDRGD